MSLFKNSSINIVFSILNSILGIFIISYLSRITSEEILGEVYTIYTSVIILTQITTLGIGPTMVLKRVGNEKLYDGIYKLIFTGIIKISLILVLIGLILFNNNLTLIIILFILSIYRYFIEYYFLGKNDMIRSGIIVTVENVIRLLLFIYTYQSAKNIDLQKILIIGNISGLIAICLLLKKLPFKSSYKLEKKVLLKSEINYSLRTWVSNLIAVLSQRLDLILISTILGNSSAGIYSVITSISEIPSKLSLFISKAIFLNSAQDTDQNKTKSIEVTHRIIFWTTFISLPVFILYIDDLIKYLYGSNYLEYQKLIIAFIFSSILLNSSQIIGTHLNGIGLNKLTLKALSISFILGLLTNLIFLSYKGLVIAIIASYISYGSYNLYMILIGKRHGLKIKRLFL